MERTKGWLCPQCNKAHGPHVDTCPEGGEGTIRREEPLTWRPTDPLPIWMPSPTTDPYFPMWPDPFITTCVSVPSGNQSKLICWG